VPHCRLVKKLEAHGIRGNIVTWITDWLKGRKQRVCLYGIYSCWQTVWSGVPQGSVLGPVLFLIFINDLDCNITSTILKFADDTKLISIVNNDDDSSLLQHDLTILENWTHSWQMEFNIDKCKVMHVGKTNIHSIYHMSNTVLGTTSEENDLGLLVSDDLKVSKHCAYSKANRTLVSGFLAPPCIVRCGGGRLASCRWPAGGGCSGRVPVDPRAGVVYDRIWSAAVSSVLLAELFSGSGI